MNVLPQEIITSKIHLIRGYKVILDRDLANLYGVETKRLNEQVRRNIKRFPARYMFQLTKEEVDNLQSQIATANISSKSRSLPYVFTEHGVAMLSSVLTNEKAIQVKQVVRKKKRKPALFYH